MKYPPMRHLGDDLFLCGKLNARKALAPKEAMITG
jgi:hypothetical protein